MTRLPFYISEAAMALPGGFAVALRQYARVSVGGGRVSGMENPTDTPVTESEAAAAVADIAEEKSVEHIDGDGTGGAHVELPKDPPMPTNLTSDMSGEVFTPGLAHTLVFQEDSGKQFAAIVTASHKNGSVDLMVFGDSAAAKKNVPMCKIGRDKKPVGRGWLLPWS